MVQIMVDRSLSNPNYVLAGCVSDQYWFLNDPSDFEREYGWQYGYPSIDSREFCCCQLFEAYGGVGYRRNMFMNSSLPFEKYFSKAIEDHRCFRSDDLVISNYLTLLGYKALKTNVKIQQLHYNYDKDALQRLDTTGHPYASCLRHLRSLNLASVMNISVFHVEGMLVRIRGQRQVYLVQNHTLRPIPNSTVFVAHGWEFSHVNTVDHDTLLLPVGRVVE